MGHEEVFALRHVSLTLGKNEYVAIMGPSGSGKSTLMNMLGCLDTPTSGTYFFNGQNVSEMDDDDLAAQIRHVAPGEVAHPLGLLGGEGADGVVATLTAEVQIVEQFLAAIDPGQDFVGLHLHQIKGGRGHKALPVSYTHLTLPTNREV